MSRLLRSAVGARSIPVAVALAIALTLLAATNASAKVTIGYCQGHGVETFTICAIVCCPGDPTPTEVCCTTDPVNCSDPLAVMAAVDACMASMMYAGMPIFGPGVPVGSPVGGQLRHEYPLSGPFAAAGCCVIGGHTEFHCGTMSAAWNCPCSKPGGPGPGPGPFKIGILGPPPSFPTTLTVWFIGCPPISIDLDGTETPAMVAAKLLAALLAAGYTAFINDDGQVEVVTDCTGGPPLGVEEFGLGGGAPLASTLGACPPESPTPQRPKTWGTIKAFYGR